MPTGCYCIMSSYAGTNVLAPPCPLRCVSHRYVEAFGDLKLTSSWAGLYEYNVFDQNACIDIHPDVPNLVLCNGFSGHGLQQSPAAGRAVAELITTGGSFTTTDLSLFSFSRFARNERVLETGIV